MISTNSIINAFVISTITTIFLKAYEKANSKEYENGEYIKIYLIVLLASMLSFYLKDLVSPFFSSFSSKNKGKLTGGNMHHPKPVINNNNLIRPPNMLSGGFNIPSVAQNFIPNNMNFNSGPPTF